MADLWSNQREARRRLAEPLAVRMRPRTLAEFAGQTHILGEGKLLSRMLKADAITSLILHGPPGTGKTTLAELIASHTRRHFEREHAAMVGVKRIKEIIDQAHARLSDQGRRTILFLDEIHRFTRAQQDVLLADVERGVLTLIGATTENPLFAVNPALVSRSTLFRLEPLSVEEVRGVLRRAIADPDRGYGLLPLRVDDAALEVWAIKCDGDARRALTALEVAVLSSLPEEADTAAHPRSPAHAPRPEAAENSDAPEDRARDRAGRAKVACPIVIDRATAEDSIQRKAAVYDQTGDQHYDCASAMIKSLRGSDPDAAIYWIARMLDGGEDPRFIARRLAILASEDIGNADPRAIMVAQAAWDLVERIGMPEARITLAQAAAYLACCPKSNASYTAIDEAMTDVKEGRTLPVPIYLRDPNSAPVSIGPAGLASRAADAAGETYQYSHDAAGGVTGQDYLGVDKEYYRPHGAGAEGPMLDRLRQRRELRRKAGPTP